MGLVKVLGRSAIVVSALILVPCTLHAQSKHAATPSHVPLADALTGPAKAAYTSAKLLFNNGDFAGALTKYGVAYEIAKDPRLLYNMALCEKNLRHYARMQGLLVRFQKESGDSLPADQRSAVEAALAAIQNLVGSVVVKVTPGAAVSLDGKSIGVAPITDPLALDLGEHTLVVSKTGFDPVTRTVAISGSDQQQVEVTLIAKEHMGHLAVAVGGGSTIFVDGQAVGADRYEGKVSAGTHDIRATAPDKMPFQSEIEIHDGESRSVEATLNSVDHGAPIWPWIVGGIVVAGGAAVGGYVLFKPTDRTNAVEPPAGHSQQPVVQFASWGSH